ncbi:hypothetical protein P879_02182 [Paragonimus westermani]|uniref:Uncharacterized protein n=1 Tax=Paragonimus westermani TaxID=34504 RepID=A0A8T0DQP5_9TREM|nr:hypothetical protein P879_02182 [Paragonimus westermani]
MLQLNALESYSKQTWLKTGDQIPSCSRLVEWFIVRRIQLAHKLCINQLRALDHRTISPNTEHQGLNRLLADSQNGVTDLIGHLRRLINTRLQWTNEWAAGEFPIYDLHVRLPREMDVVQLFTKLTMVERCCTQTKRRLSESTLNTPLSLPKMEVTNGGRPDEDAIAYSRDLLKQLVRCLYNRARMRDCVGRTCEQAEKLRDLISTISGHVNEIRSVTHQLNVAIPTLTGFHMDELTEAVVELESMTNEDRSERSNSVSAYKSSDNIGFTQHIKHAGRRLMELETCLEHACETVRVLLLFGRGSKFWKHLPNDVSLSANERAIGLENAYEDSFICAQLRTAWTRLAQLGDRLGRIQAGLPVRPSNESSAGTLDEVHSTELDVSRRSTANRMESDFGLADSTDDNVPSAQRMDAEVVRKTSWNLRDLLGEHSCVYPECKQARDEMFSCVLVASKDQIGINEQVRETFINLVHFYAELKKDLIERVRPAALQNSSPSTPPTRLMTAVRFRWQRDPDLVKEYEELMDQVIALKCCDLPQVRKLELKAKSLESLWWGPHGTVAKSGEFDPQEPHGWQQPEPRQISADLSQSPEDRVQFTSCSSEHSASCELTQVRNAHSTSSTHALQSPHKLFSRGLSDESTDQHSDPLNETQSTSISGELAIGDTSETHATPNGTSEATPTYSDPSIGKDLKNCLSSTIEVNGSPFPDAYSIMTTAREIQAQKSRKAKLKRVRRQQRKKLVEQQKQADNNGSTQMLNEKSQSSFNRPPEETHENDEEHMGSLYRSPNVWLSTHQVSDILPSDNHTDSFNTFPSGPSDTASAISRPGSEEKIDSLDKVHGKNVQMNVELSHGSHSDRVNEVWIHGKYSNTSPSLLVSHSPSEDNDKDQKVTHKSSNLKPHDDSDLQTIRLPLAASSPAIQEIPKPSISGLTDRQKSSSVCHTIETIDEVSKWATDPLVVKLAVSADKVSFVKEIDCVPKSDQKHEIPSSEAMMGNNEILFATSRLSASSNKVHDLPAEWKPSRSNGVTIEAESKSTDWIKVERKLTRKPRTRKQRTLKSAASGPLKASISDFSKQNGEHAVTVDANTAALEEMVYNSEVSDPTGYPHAIPEPQVVSETELEASQNKSTMHTVLEMVDLEPDQHTMSLEQTDYTIIPSLNLTDLLNADVPSSEERILKSFESRDQPSAISADGDVDKQQGTTIGSWGQIDCAQLDPDPSVTCGKPSPVGRNQQCSNLESITEQPQITNSSHDSRQNESSYKRSYQSDTKYLETIDGTGDNHAELLGELVNESRVTSPQTVPLLNGIEMPSLSDDPLQHVTLDQPHANIDSTHQIEHDPNMFVPSKAIMDGGVRRKIRKAKRHGKTTISSPTDVRPTVSIPQRTRQPTDSDQTEAESDHQLVKNDSFESNHSLHTNSQLAERDEPDNSPEQKSSANSRVNMADEFSSLRECFEVIDQSSEMNHSLTPHFSEISKVDGRKEMDVELIEGHEIENIDYSTITTSLDILNGEVHTQETSHVITAPINTEKTDDSDLAVTGLSFQPHCELDMKNNVVDQENERIQESSAVSLTSGQDTVFRSEFQRSPTHLPCHKEFVTDKNVGSASLVDQPDESAIEFRGNKFSTTPDSDQERSCSSVTNQRSLESELNQIRKLQSDSSSFQRSRERTDFIEVIGGWKDNSQRSSLDQTFEDVQRPEVYEVSKPDSTTKHSVNEPPMAKFIGATSRIFDCSHLNVSMEGEKYKPPNNDAGQAVNQPNVTSHLGSVPLSVEKVDNVDSISNIVSPFEQSNLTSPASLSCATDPKIGAHRIKAEVPIEDRIHSRTPVSSDSKMTIVNVYNQNMDSTGGLLSDPFANRELKTQSDRLTIVCRKSSRSGSSALDRTEAKPVDKLPVLEATQSSLRARAEVKLRHSDKKKVGAALRIGHSDQFYDFSVPTDLITAESHWVHPKDLGVTRKHVNMEYEMNQSTLWIEVGTQTEESYAFHQEVLERHSVLENKEVDDDENEFDNVCNTAKIVHTQKYSEHYDEGKYVHIGSSFVTQNISQNKSMQFDWMVDKAIQTDAYTKEILIRRRQCVLSNEQDLQQQVTEAKQQGAQKNSQEQLDFKGSTNPAKSTSGSIIEPVASVVTTRNSCCRYLLPLLALLLLLFLLLLLLFCLFSKPTCTGINHSSEDCVEQTMLWRFLYRPLHTVRFRDVPI